MSRPSLDAPVCMSHPFPSFDYIVRALTSITYSSWFYLCVFWPFHDPCERVGGTTLADADLYSFNAAYHISAEFRWRSVFRARLQSGRSESAKVLFLSPRFMGEAGAGREAITVGFTKLSAEAT